MRASTAFSAIGTFFEMVGSAVAASNAVRSKKRPAAEDLRKLGIDPESFRTMRF